MFNKHFLKTICLAVIFCCLAGAGRAELRDITLLMVPRSDETAVKLGSDMATQFPNTLLVSYVSSHSGVSLHGWTGSQWVNITSQDFKDGKFFKNGPTSALLVEEEGRPVSSALIPPESWCRNVGKIATTDPRTMVHLVGRYYDVKYKTWEWLAKRYGMDLEQINPDGLNVRWYHRRMSDNLAARNRVVADDLKYFVVLRKYVEPEPEPVPAVVEEPVAKVEEETVEETEEEVIEDKAEPKTEEVADEEKTEPKVDAEPETAETEEKVIEEPKEVEEKAAEEVKEEGADTEEATEAMAEEKPEKSTAPVAVEKKVEKKAEGVFAEDVNPAIVVGKEEESE